MCQTLLSDIGSENISKCMKGVCRQLHIQQEFTPSFVHSCLGSVNNHTKHWLNSKCNNWLDVLPSITFSYNQSVNASSGYSPHEIVFGHRPHFPLTAAKPTDFDTKPLDARTYVRKHAEKLGIIRTEVRNKFMKSQETMLARANAQINPLYATPGDYVFLLTETVGVGQQLKHHYVGPYVIDKFSSPHMAVLRNPDTGVCMKTHVHLDRLKMAYIREPQPTPYFMSRVATCENGQQTNGENNAQSVQNVDDNGGTLLNQKPTSDEQTIDCVVQNLRQSSRTHKVPERYGFGLNSEEVISSEDGLGQVWYLIVSIPDLCTLTYFKDSHGFHKVKRFLGQRPHRDTTEYLVQLRGEPAESAIWIPFSSLELRNRLHRRPHQSF